MPLNKHIKKLLMLPDLQFVLLWTLYSIHALKWNLKKFIGFKNINTFILIRCITHDKNLTGDRKNYLYSTRYVIRFTCSKKLDILNLTSYRKTAL